jgi:hypothetical protein
MDTKGIELVVLAAISAFLCWTALYLGHQITGAVFAACSSGVMAVALRHLRDRSASPKRFDGTEDHKQCFLGQLKSAAAPQQ